MSTTQTPDIDGALKSLVRAKLPTRLEADLQHIVNVLLSVPDSHPATILVAAAMTDRIARLYRITGCDDLFYAASALGAEVHSGLMGAIIESTTKPPPKVAAPAEPETLSRSDNWRKDLLRAVITADQEGELPVDLHVQMDGCGPSGEGTDKLRIRVEEVSEIPDVLHLEVPRRMERDVEAKPKVAAPAEQDKAAKAETIEKIARLAKSDPDKFGEFALQLALKARDTLRTAGHATTEIDEAIKGLIGCRLTPDEAQVMCDPIVRLLKDAPDVDAAQAEHAVEHAVELAVAPDKAATEAQQ